MNITILNQFYLPDSAPTAQLAGSLAEYLANRGHAVTIVCGRGTYAVGAGGTPPSGGVRVVRLWTPALGKRTLGSRAADYLSFYVQAAAYMPLLSRQDAVVAMTTPPFVALAAWLHTFVHRRAALVLWNMDSYPEVAEMTGHVRRGSVLSRLLRAANRFLFRRLDLVVALDEAMAKCLIASYAPADRSGPEVVVVPNWERSAAFPPLSERGPRPDGLAGSFVVIYLGNAGNAHEFAAVLDAAEMLRDRPITFLFVGGGSRWAELDRLRRERGIANIILRGYVPKDESNALMAGCNVGLITLRSEALGLVSPSKLHAYLAMSLPVIYVGPASSNVDEAVRVSGVGFSLRPGDGSGLAAAVTTLFSRPDIAAEMGRRARRAFEEYFCDKRAAPQLEASIARAVSHRASRYRDRRISPTDQAGKSAQNTL